MRAIRKVLLLLSIISFCQPAMAVDTRLYCVWVSSLTGARLASFNSEKTKGVFDSGQPIFNTQIISPGNTNYTLLNTVRDLSAFESSGWIKIIEETDLIVENGFVTGTRRKTYSENTPADLWDKWEVKIST